MDEELLVFDEFGVAVREEDRGGGGLGRCVWGGDKPCFDTTPIPHAAHLVFDFKMIDDQAWYVAPGVGIGRGEMAREDDGTLNEQGDDQPGGVKSDEVYEHASSLVF